MHFLLNRSTLPQTAPPDSAPFAYLPLQGGHSFIHCSVPVDGDPHFVIRLPKKDQRLCFTVDGEANDVLRLVEDTERGNALKAFHCISYHDMPDRTRTYFDQITITVARNGAVGVTITLTLDSVVIDGEETVALSTSHSAAVTKPGVQVVINSHQGCWIRLKKDVIFLVLFHRYDHQSYLQMAHLGFYIAEGKGLSPHSQGLLGISFHYPHAANFHHGQLRPGASLALGVLKHKDVLIPVSLQEKHLKDTLGKKHMDQCWVVPKVEVEKLLGLSYLSYVVDHI
uniref:Inter-alpha-trypsin inhibitor heavy chain family member 6 n=1 Tax=Denticeps clupeoides TaxID=299321 RepID=A0AAY4C1Z5_9TELE